MQTTWDANVITLFPQCFPGPLGLSIPSRAMQNKAWALHVHDLRAHGIGPHKVVDDAPYGGGPGMLIRPDVLDAALCAVTNHKDPVIYLSPRGAQFTQAIAHTLVQHKTITLVCGRYEGIDQRVLDYWNVREIRISDAVLCGGELAAMVVLEACVRLLPGVIDAESLKSETFAERDVTEYPQYTRPALWKKIGVPKVLLSGDHGKVTAWRIDHRGRLPDMPIYTSTRSDPTY